MRTLLVDDDLVLGTALQQTLSREGHKVVWLRTIEDARRFLLREEFSVVLLDRVFPGESGLDLVRWMRGRGMDTPVLMLTAHDSLNDRVECLDSGADDFLPKPIAVKELMSRMRALVRRHTRRYDGVFRLGNLTIDGDKRTVMRDDTPVPLSPREYRLLVAMAAQPGRVFSRNDLLVAAAMAGNPESNAVDVHVHNLRRKLGGSVIGTVRGAGYFIEPSAGEH